jgi:hypothetical protein
MPSLRPSCPSCPPLPRGRQRHLLFFWHVFCLRPLGHRTTEVLPTPVTPSTKATEFVQSIIPVYRKRPALLSSNLLSPSGRDKSFKAYWQGTKSRPDPSRARLIGSHLLRLLASTILHVSPLARSSPVFTMILCFILIAACIVLHGADSSLLRLSGLLPFPIFQADTLHWVLKWGVTSWAVLELNSVLNRWAENRWLWRNDVKSWDWKNEIAVITGGSQGIGACVVKDLVSHGITCAVLDVVPLSADFTKCVGSSLNYCGE